MNPTSIHEIVNSNRPFKYGEYIGKGFELFGQNVGNFAAFSFLSVVIMSFAGSIPYVGALGSRYLLVPTLTAGFYIVAHQLNKGERAEFGDHFLGFQHLVRLTLAGIAISFITTVATVPFLVANGNLISWSWELSGLADNFNLDTAIETFPGFSTWTFLLFLPMIYFGVAYSWTSQFIIFHHLNVWDAMEASRKLITKHWFVYFLFAITILLIGFGGLAGFLVGVFFTYPIMLCINYAAFADLTDLDKVEAEEYVDIYVK